MKQVHIVIPDLFLPPQLASYAYGDLYLPATQKLLARAQISPLTADSLEAWLCERFDVENMAIAPLSLQADGITAGDSYWLRADPVGISLQREQMVLQADITLTVEESALLCASLNAHFGPDGLRFIAPHPQRWYLQLEKPPGISTYALPQVVGSNMHKFLPYGEEALRWHSVINEIQMLFHDHIVNQDRERLGMRPVNAVWFWGGGKLIRCIRKSYSHCVGDSALAMAFALESGMSTQLGSDVLSIADDHWAGDILLVFEALRVALLNADIGQWRIAAQLFENNYATPLLRALAQGHLDKIIINVPAENGARQFVVSRSDLLRVWRRPKPFAFYSHSLHST